MNEQYTIANCLILATNVLNLVQTKLAQLDNSNHSVYYAKENINNALTTLEKDELAALIEYQITLENLMNNEEDFRKYVDLL